MTSILKVDTIQTAAGGTPTAADLGLNVTGSVLQVVSATVSTESSTTSTSLVDTGLTASITPTSVTSKILVLYNLTVRYRATAANFNAEVALLRNSTTISNDYVEGYYASSGTTDTRESRQHGQSFLDSPNTISSVTYKVQGRAPTQPNGSALFHYNNKTSSITLIEIAG